MSLFTKFLQRLPESLDVLLATLLMVHDGLGIIFSPVQIEPEIVVTTDNSNVSDADKQSLIERVEKDFGKPNPSLGYLAIGYNF